jgi:hypothetical protein
MGYWGGMVSVGLGAALLLASAGASAQTVTLGAEPPARLVNVDGRMAVNRNWISRADCLADDAFTFQVTLTDFAGYWLEVWAGAADCTAYEARLGASPQCWLVYQTAPSSTTLSARIRVQDIAAQHRHFDVPNGAGSGTAADCASALDNQAVALTFMLVDSIATVANHGRGTATFNTAFDLTGPFPPTYLQV